MYGMVNKAIEDLVRQSFGDDAWDRIKEQAGIDVDIFISNEGYPDDLTYKLVGAASAVTGMPADKILFAFGEHWLLKIARQEYGGLLEAGGRTLRDFLINLPNFHARIMLIFPKLQPPRFRVEETGERELELHYLTHRDGLGAFVVGIVSGLGKMFESPVEITQLAFRSRGDDHDVFHLTWSATGAASS